MAERRLLVADDDPEICKVLQEVGHACGYETRSVHTGKEFLKALQTFNPTFVTLDLLMNESDGVELLRNLSHENYRHPIILLSGQDERVISAAFKLGKIHGLNMVDGLQKPLKVSMMTYYLSQLGHESTSPTYERLLKAITENKLILHYQPKVNMKTQEIVGCEALIRWRLNDNSTIYPDSFIGVAEQTNLIKPMTQWVIRECFRQLRQWIDSKMGMGVAINLSANLLTNLSLPDDIMAVAEEFRISPSMITFEVTETAVMTQPKLAMEILTRLRVKGFNLSIDDFGTGYSSLVELYRMPFNELKIDKSFIIELDTNVEAQVIARSIIELAHNLGLNIVAEGIENNASQEILAKMGCDQGQGYFFGKPMSSENFLLWTKDFDKRLGK
jgi:sensor c-di-GMP phosphodiesterase-like protein